MRRNPSTVVALVGDVQEEFLDAVDRSPGVVLVRPRNRDPDLAAAADALRGASRAAVPYAVVPADPLAAVAAAWRAMWDMAQAAAEFERQVGQVVAAWRAERFELPDYYLVVSPRGRGGNNRDDQTETTADPRHDFYLGPLRATRPHRVALVPAADAVHGQRALRALDALRYGPWWPPLDELVDAVRRFSPAHLPEAQPARVTLVR